jgi:hypothetical protein
MKTSIKILVVCVLVATMTIANAGVALAGGEDEYVVRPDSGPEVEGFTPGVGGYKVFGPNAIATQAIQSEKESGGDIGTLGTGLYRHALTDIWEAGGETVMGSHTSDSDLYEDEIWVDGAIKIDGQGWYDSDEDHTTGMFAHCTTQMPDPIWLQTFIAHSWHHFHTDGYVDWNPETEDSIET